MSDLMYNPTNGSLFNKRGMKSIEKLKFLDSLEDIYRYTGPDALAVFYPSRVLPSVYIDTDAEWPIVMPPGLIVSSKNIKDAQAYASGETETGILTSGEVYVTIDMEGTAQKMSINYLYPNEIAGILVPANGGDASALSYSDNDGEYGIVLANGAAADADADDLSISANVPIGIVNGRVYADLRERYQGYDKSHAVSVQRGGVLTLPYVLIYGAGVTATVLAAVRSAVNAKHQYVWFSGSDADTVEGYLENGTLLKSDLYGRFTRWDSSSDDQNQIFGEVVGLRNRVPYALDEIID
ncbi:MAG TPA: hypothetical protein PLI62_13630, partial [Spirochaetota bacterium]|nr:hypothetical protein [Spirochaetota bacterium]